ncbi:MAG: PIN domain nuclease [bacterium]
MILIDTSIWISYFSKEPDKHKDAVRSLITDNRPIVLTGVIVTEILQGIREESVLAKIKEILLSFPLLNFEMEDYLLAADIYRQGRRRGITIRSTIDCLIAAISINKKLVLYHNDKDYQQIHTFTPLIFFDG